MFQNICSESVHGLIMGTAKLPKEAEPARAARKSSVNFSQICCFLSTWVRHHSRSSVKILKCILKNFCCTWKNGHMVLNCAHFGRNISRRLRKIRLWNFKCFAFHLFVLRECFLQVVLNLCWSLLFFHLCISTSRHYKVIRMAANWASKRNFVSDEENSFFFLILKICKNETVDSENFALNALQKLANKQFYVMDCNF